MSIPVRIVFQSKLDSLFKEVKTQNYEPIHLSHWSRYLCVLTSGYLEKSIKEALQRYADARGWPEVSRYFDKTWQKSRNMKCDVICEILGNFNEDWRTSFEKWLEEDEQRKAGINNLISWRNRLSHGEDVTGVSYVSTKESFKLVNDVLDKIEQIIR
jgi:hypothetical protein